MTTKELIELLSKLPENITVLLSSDDEGNAYHTVAEDVCLDRKKSYVILYPDYKEVEV